MASVKRIPPPGMSHGHATLHLTAGTPTNAVSEGLGHVKISITLDTYAHALPDMQDRAAEAFDAALLRSSFGLQVVCVNHFRQGTDRTDTSPSRFPVLL
jgi:predicted secreted protein